MPHTLPPIRHALFPAAACLVLVCHHVRSVFSLTATEGPDDACPLLYSRTNPPPAADYHTHAKLYTSSNPCAQHADDNACFPDTDVLFSPFYGDRHAPYPNAASDTSIGSRDRRPD